MPKVSVIIPNYNHAKFLVQRIETVLNQTFQDFEIIFLDDASTDNSKEVFSNYSNHPKISHAIFNEANSGSPFKQWNKGFGLVTGEYIWIAESDDYAEPTILEKLVQKLDSYPMVGLVYSQSWQVDENGTIGSTLVKWTDDLDRSKWLNDFNADGMDECKNYFSVKCVIPNASAVLFRNQFIFELDSDIEKLKLCGDWLFWIKILLKSDLSFITEPLNYFRQHGNTARVRTKFEIQVLEQVIILNYLSLSVKIPKKVLYQSISNLVKRYFRHIYLEPLNYKDLLKFYKQTIINSKLKLTPYYYIAINTDFLVCTFLLLRYKFGVKTRIKNLFKKGQPVKIQ
ncbi:glycosyltransferase family 2 protein [Dolichospermum sp. UHCC 0259]|uniref:glycosyltransferase family 2 protein n=1 Tax=Dolichospermum sp. UHCC 0259 TaxID=2590010 RepID=UPI0014464BC5|nr:glycosyltransferase family 2 protein [Dolichospermum sp. UHCC 0259]MTJ50314.1 glycosyltransferase [Dolichospermum sp. UHCC 0259]